MKHFKKINFLSIHFNKIRFQSKYFGYTCSLGYAGFIHYNLFKLFKHS